MPFLEVKSPRWTRRIDLISDPVSVGRLPENGIQFNDDGLSRQHCVFERTPEGWQIRDLGSRNGTKLNGSKVTAAALASGDIVRIGTLEIRFVDPEPAKPEAARTPAAPSRATARPGATIDATPATQSPYEAAIRQVCDGAISKPFGESDIALVDARGAVMHAATGAGESNDEDEAPAESIHIFRMLLLTCFRSRASDLHIEPRTDKAVVRIRVDGTMVTVVEDLPLQVFRRVIGVTRVLCHFDQSVKSEVLDGHFNVTVKGRRVDYRVSLTPAVHGNKLVIRVLDPANAPSRLHELGMLPWMYEKLRTVCNRDAGLMLACGPTGSGKTTSLYSCLREIDLEQRNAITIEDPVEYQIEGATQIPIDAKQGHTFGGLLRSILRQDPDVILVGEIRDVETANVAMQAAMTGHLVFSTVHARDTIGSIFRLLDLGVESYLVANALDIVVAQRLVRILCGTCRRPVKPTPQQQMRMGKSLGGMPDIYAPSGCQYCLDTGFYGRRAIFEVLEFNDALRDVVLKKPTMQQIREVLATGLFTSLQGYGFQMVASGITSYEEIERVASSDA
ncbi:MAG: Flp pilus assembly complex ATPase component TadA [Planctomycetaceae bacterium]|jgi:general secretion pathway protein E|nr:Flp pilus assembly complex ATPase component TadA [Planctomycetaceae bacterium]